jgi:S1-C subfamily serine protease
MRGITRNHGNETEPAAFGILAGLGVLLVAAIALGCGEGCARYTTLPSAPRQLDTQGDTVVEVETLCVVDDPFEHDGKIEIGGGMGTGVMLDGRHVLTADHVVACGYLPDVHVVTSTGRRLRMVVRREDPSTDLALLEIASGDTFGAIAPPIIGPRPHVGDTICKLEAVPARGGDCGTVTDLRDTADSDVGHDAPTHHGNSGGPVYDPQGRLIGITTELLMPDGDHGGRFTSLAPRGKEMIP